MGEPISLHLTRDEAAVARTALLVFAANLSPRKGRERRIAEALLDRIDTLTRTGPLFVGAEEGTQDG